MNDLLSRLGLYILIADLWLVLKIERASHWVTRLTGWSVFLQKRAVAACTMVVIVLYTIREARSAKPSWPFVIWMFLCSLIQLRDATYGSRLDGRIAEDAENGLMNRNKMLLPFTFLRIMWSIWQTIFFLTFLSAGPFRWDILLWGQLIWLNMYLEAVDPLPPCKGKVKEWLSSLGRKPVPVGVEA